MDTGLNGKWWSSWVAGLDTSPGGVRTILSPFQGSIVCRFHPRLAPWAALFRRFTAEGRVTRFTASRLKVVLQIPQRLD